MDHKMLKMEYKLKRRAFIYFFTQMIKLSVSDEYKALF